MVVILVVAVRFKSSMVKRSSRFSSSFSLDVRRFFYVGDIALRNGLFYLEDVRGKSLSVARCLVGEVCKAF